MDVANSKKTYRLESKKRKVKTFLELALANEKDRSCNHADGLEQVCTDYSSCVTIYNT